jgi:flagellar biosynthesis protein FlhB
MADEPSASEKTEQPSLKRREDARRKGQAAKSPDLTAAVFLLGALGACTAAGPRFVLDATAVLRHGLVAVAEPELASGDAIALFLATCASIAHLAWPFVLIPAAAAIGIQLLQTRFAVSWEGLKPQMSRVDPLKGLGRFLGTKGMVDGLKTTVKLGVLIYVAVVAVRGAWGALLDPGHGEGLLITVAAVVSKLWLAIAIAYLVIALFDYGHRWWENEKSLRMTKEEVRLEGKEQEGNPELKQRLRALHRQRAARRMMTEVERADVVVRNPIHVAVALRYDPAAMRAPRVVAKGARLVARRIVAIAMRHGVPVIESPPLARSLYRQVAVGQEISGDLYRLVAEVLAHVYALRAGAR